MTFTALIPYRLIAANSLWPIGVRIARTLFALLLFCVLLCPSPAEAQSNRILFRGQQIYVKGVNVPWDNYSRDFGGGGTFYNSTFWQTCFSNLRNNNYNAARTWTMTDGAVAPLFDQAGTPIGMPAAFFTAMDDMLARAEANQIYVILSLLDFQWFGLNPNNGPNAGNHGIVVTDPAKTTAFINNVLKPLMDKYAGHPRILAWEIFNEPEWAITENPDRNTGLQSVSLSAIQTFVAKCAQYIHSRDAQALVTVGSAGLYYNSTGQYCLGNYWSDSALKAKVGGDAKGTLDFFQIHYYDFWNPWYAPYDKPISYWALNKPVLIGESPCRSSIFSSIAQRDQASARGFAGLMWWSYKGVDEHGVWSDVSGIYSGWAPAAPNNAITSVSYPNSLPSSGTINIPVSYTVNTTRQIQVRVYDSAWSYKGGATVSVGASGSTTVAVSYSGLTTSAANVRVQMFDTNNSTKIDEKSRFIPVGTAVVYGFEGSTQSWSRGWGETPSLSSSADQWHSGSNSLKVQFSKTSTGQVGAGIGINNPANAAGKKAEFWVWVPNTSTFVALQPFAQMAPNYTWTSGGWITSVTKGAWNRVSVSVPSGTVQCIGVEIILNGPYSGAFYIDSVSY